MADKILKSITFPGSEDVYVIESGVGRDTEYGGEIFNDYENNQATGLYSHAEGEYTIAKGKAQHVAGKYNLEDTEIDDAGYGKYAYIIGGGTLTTNRKNIHTVDWDGNAWYAGKITVGANPTEALDVATKEYVDNLAFSSETTDSYDAYLEFDALEGLQAALAEQATLMMNNNENFRKVHLNDGTFHLLASGTGIANLYSHRGTDQDEYTYVIAEIISRDKVYYMNFSNEFENWDPSTMNKVLTANDQITATAIKDKTYTTIPVYPNYGAPDITDPSDFNSIAAWRYIENSTALELRSLPADTLAKKLEQYLRNYFYTEDEVDAKISNINGGGSAGMVREFQATNETSLAGTAGPWTYYGNNSKFYIITLRYNPTGGVGSSGKLFSVTVDYKAILNNSPTTFYATDSVGVTITKTVDSNGYFQSITFKVATANTVFSEICGYY